MGKGVFFQGNPCWCSICGLRIPEEIVHFEHPLFGTVDHLIPTSRGGSNGLKNRYPAHLLCNRVKGCRYPTADEQEELRLKVKGYLERLGFKIDERKMREARERSIEITPPLPKPNHVAPYSRWEDDGGALYLDAHEKLKVKPRHRGSI